MYIHIGCTLSPKKEVGVGEEESSGIGEVEVVVREKCIRGTPPYTFHGTSRNRNRSRSRSRSRRRSRSRSRSRSRIESYL